jgi:hypothetical protein
MMVLARQKDEITSYFNPQLLMILMIAQCVYLIPYSPNYEQSIIFGMTLSLAQSTIEDE